MQTILNSETKMTTKLSNPIIFIALLPSPSIFKHAHVFFDYVITCMLCTTTKTYCTFILSHTE